jgi:hypothetical protein
MIALGVKISFGVPSDSNSNCFYKYLPHYLAPFSPLFSRLPYRTTKANIPLAIQNSVALSQHVEQLHEHLIQLYVSEALYRYLAVARENRVRRRSHVEHD